MEPPATEEHVHLFHGHYDKLSFVFYAHGRELGVDPGRARSQAYRLPIHRDWYKATISHNTVVVDGASQAPASGRLLIFDPQDQYTLVVAQCDEAYQGILQTRLLLQTTDYLLVFDDLVTDAEHRFDWIYQVPPCWTEPLWYGRRGAEIRRVLPPC